MKLDVFKAFDNPLSEYLTSKDCIEYTGYIFIYLPKLNSSLELVSNAQFANIFSMKIFVIQTCQSTKLQYQTFFTQLKLRHINVRIFIFNYLLLQLQQ